MAGNTYIVPRDAQPGGALNQNEALLTVDESTHRLTLASIATTGAALSIVFNPNTERPTQLDGSSAVPASAASTIAFYIDEAGNQLTITVVYANGVTTKSANIALT